MPARKRAPRPPAPRAWAALAGVAAGGVGLGVGELSAGLLPRMSSPVVAVGDVIIDHAPLAPWVSLRG